MWYRCLVLTGFCGILMVTNGCAITTSCGSGCGECCGEAGCSPADFAGGGPIGLSPVPGHQPACGCDAPCEVVVPDCAAPAFGAACGCSVPSGPDCTCSGNCGCGGIVVDSTCAAPAGCPTCSAPGYHQQAPPLAPAPGVQPVHPQSAYPPAGTPYMQGLPLGVPTPTESAPAGDPAETAPAATAPIGDDPGSGGEPNFEPPTNSTGFYRRPRVIRPVNAVPMGGGYYIQQQSGQVPMQRVQRQVPMRPVRQQVHADDLPVMHFD